MLTRCFTCSSPTYLTPKLSTTSENAARHVVTVYTTADRPIGVSESIARYIGMFQLEAPAGAVRRHTLAHTTHKLSNVARASYGKYTVGLVQTFDD